MYKIGKATKMGSSVAQSLGYFVAVFNIRQLIYMIQEFFLIYIYKGTYRCKLVNLLFVPFPILFILQLRVNMEHLEKPCQFPKMGCRLYHRVVSKIFSHTLVNNDN